MAFTVAPTADYTSFIAEAFADTYHADRLNTAWEAAEIEDKRAALIRATDYITLKYTPITAFVTDTVASSVKTATAMLALHCLTEDPFAPQDREVTEESSSLDGVASETLKYAARSTDRYPMVTAMLATVAKPNSSSVVVTTQVR